MKAEIERQEAHKKEQAETDKQVNRLFNHYAGEEGATK